MRPRLGVWPPLAPGVHLRRPVSRLPWPLDTRQRLFARGRHALWHGLHELGLQPGDVVLMPSYHHGSEVEAMLAAGLECRFYAGTEQLAPDAVELERLLDERVRALHLIHYLGFPQDAGRWRRWCDARGLWLIEDAAQSWLATTADGRPVGSDGHLAIFCLYKTLALPDGAALVTSRCGDSGSAADDGIPEDGYAAGAGSAGVRKLARLHAAWLMGRAPLAARLGTALDHRRPYDPARDMELGDPDSRPSAATTWLLPRSADPTVAAERRLRYRVLLDGLGSRVPPPFDTLPAGASPFAFPILADKDSLMTRLADRGIAGLDLWSVPHPSLPVDAYPAAARRRSRTIGLPVHQELLPRDLDRIVRTVDRSAQRSEVRLELVDRDAVAEAWRRLAADGGNIFATPEWAMTWSDGGSDLGELEITAACDPDGAVVGIVPLERNRVGSFDILRFLGHGPADELGPIAAPDARIRVAAALRRAVTHGRWGDRTVLLAERMRGDESWPGLLGGRRLRREASPVLRLERDWEGLLATFSPNLRQQLRRRERRLARRRRLSFRLADDPVRLGADLDALFALHRRRWGPNTTFSRWESFHRSFAACALERGWLRLWFLELDGAPAAVWYGFRFSGVESYYQAARDARFDEESVGSILLGHTIRSAADDGMREYRFLRGAEAYKYRFATSDPGIETVALAASPLAEVGVRAVEALAARPELRAARRRMGVG